MTFVQDRLAGPDAARRAMIDSQLRPSGINAEFVLQRMATVERERFVPETAHSFAYIDRALPLGQGRFLAAPAVHGAMLQEAAPTLSDSALLVDGGSGYLAELLRPLVGELEVLDPTSAAAGATVGSGFTLLLIDGAVEHVPEALVARLAEGARVVTGLAEKGVTRLAVGRKTADDIALLPLAEIGIPALPEFALPKGWSF